MVHHPELARLIEVMAVLRHGCPWDAQQTHRSLVQYLIEETLEVVEAIEAGDDDHLREELGDLLLQVIFHSEIAGETGRFDLEDVAKGIADKLVGRHPHVFDPATGSVQVTKPPTDLYGSWEQRKAVEKGRSSVLDGIPEQMSAVARANKIISRARSRRVWIDLAADAISPDSSSTEAISSDPISPEEVGAQIIGLVARAQALGIDPEQAVRDAVRNLERRVRDTERGGSIADREARHDVRPGLSDEGAGQGEARVVTEGSATRPGLG